MQEVQGLRGVRYHVQEVWGARSARYEVQAVQGVKCESCEVRGVQEVWGKGNKECKNLKWKFFCNLQGTRDASILHRSSRDSQIFGHFCVDFCLYLLGTQQILMLFGRLTAYIFFKRLHLKEVSTLPNFGNISKNDIVVIWHIEQNRVNARS